MQENVELKLKNIIARAGDKEGQDIVLSPLALDMVCKLIDEYYEMRELSEEED